jgi:chloramphenicol 3-O phosphotransferase
MFTIEPGKIILLNGPSSAGKSTLCQAIQTRIDEPFLPKQQLKDGTFQWAEIRPRILKASSIACLRWQLRATIC